MCTEFRACCVFCLHYRALTCTSRPWVPRHLGLAGTTVSHTSWIGSGRKAKIYVNHLSTDAVILYTSTAIGRYEGTRNEAD